MDLPIIKTLNFPETQFYKEEHQKKQIVIHHTASGRGIDGDFKTWVGNPERVATSQIIDTEGVSWQCFNSKYWAYHLGLKTANNKTLNESSIAIEIDSWGGLIYDEVNKVFKSYTGSIVLKKNVIEYEKSYRGFRFFEKYTDKQIESVRKLLLYWCDAYGIAKTYNSDMWDVSDRALSAEPGIWTHTSFRKDKSDCHPQPELIQMLMGL